MAAADDCPRPAAMLQDKNKRQKSGRRRGGANGVNISIVLFYEKKMPLFFLSLSKISPFFPIAKKELLTAERRDSVNDLSLIIANVYQHNDRYDQVAALVQSHQPFREDHDEPQAGGAHLEQAQEIMGKPAPEGGG